MSITQALIVAVGGGIGSLLRYAVAGGVLHQTTDWRFPMGTFVVNMIGCLVIGVLGGLAVKHDLFSNELRLFLFTGLLGGFTTFSAFGLETFYLLRRDELLIAGGYVVASVLLGLLLVWVGFSMVAGRSV
jgi:CrcB protein